MAHGGGWRLLAAAACIAGALIDARPAAACGGFFCNGGGGATPVVQAAERVIFEKHEDGTVRAYIQIRYDQVGGPPIGFSWIIPVLHLPEVGIAPSTLFQELDQATAPQFRFVSNPGFSAGGGGGFGCGAMGSADRSMAGGFEGAPTDVPHVTVWESDHVGNYDYAILSGETSEDLLEWLASNAYDIPEEASDIIQEYVDEDHLFVAFRYAPVDAGTGTLDPVVLTYRDKPDLKPCVPIRITAIASQPILDVMILAFAGERARPEGAFVLTEPDYEALRQDFAAATQTNYTALVDLAILDAGGHAFVTEYAGSTGSVTGITDVEARAILARNAYVTRFYTRFTPETMTVDPEFVFPGGDDVSNFHVIDLTRTAAAPRTPRGARYAAGPGALVVLGAAIAWRRRRRR